MEWRQLEGEGLREGAKVAPRFGGLPNPALRRRRIEEAGGSGRVFFLPVVKEAGWVRRERCRCGEWSLFGVVMQEAGLGMVGGHRFVGGQRLGWTSGDDGSGGG